jgi:hypothetical protein
MPPPSATGTSNSSDQEMNPHQEQLNNSSTSDEEISSSNDIIDLAKVDCCYDSKNDDVQLQDDYDSHHHLLLAPVAKQMDLSTRSQLVINPMYENMHQEQIYSSPKQTNSLTNSSSHLLPKHSRPNLPNEETYGFGTTNNLSGLSTFQQHSAANQSKSSSIKREATNNGETFTSKLPPVPPVPRRNLAKPGQNPNHNLQNLHLLPPSPLASTNGPGKKNNAYHKI